MYAINHGVTDFSPHKVALFEHVAIVISLLACFIWGGPSFSGILFSTLSSAEDGEVKMALNAYDTRSLLSKWDIMLYTFTRISLLKRPFSRSKGSQE